MRNKVVVIVIIPLIVLFILVIIKSFNKDSYEQDALSIHRQSLEQNLVLSVQEFREKGLGSHLLLVDLRARSDFKKGCLRNALNIPFPEILESPLLKMDKPDEPGIVLYSNSLIESAKAWIILAQMGYPKLYLLDIPKELISEDLYLKDSLFNRNEDLRYKFQTDSIN